MQQHVNEIAKCIEVGNHRVIVFDQAAWHTTSKLQVPKNISLLPLPPASPELNPTEQVWQALRDRFRESLLRAYLGVLLRGLECVYFCGRCGTKIMQ
jgi:transposase